MKSVRQYFVGKYIFIGQNNCCFSVDVMVHVLVLRFDFYVSLVDFLIFFITATDDNDVGTKFKAI